MRRILGILLSLILVFSGCGTKKERRNVNKQVPQGQEIYLNHCASCHGGNREGGFGPSLNQISSKYQKQDILRILQNGTGRMPSQDFISQGEREMLSTWLLEK